MQKLKKKVPFYRQTINFAPQIISTLYYLQNVRK